MTKNRVRQYFRRRDAGAEWTARVCDRLVGMVCSLLVAFGRFLLSVYRHFAGGNEEVATTQV